MNFLRRLFRRYSGATRGVERDVLDEISFHIEMRAAANAREGMTPDAARRAAERSFGDPERVRRAGREILAEAPPAFDGPGWFERFAHDVRFSVRSLRARPTMTAAAILSLTLGIGANTATYSVVHAMLFRSLPFTEPDRVLYLDSFNPDRGEEDDPITWADLGALRDTGLFAGVGAFTTRSVTVTGSERPERVAAAPITPGLFGLLGVAPALGREFRQGEGAEAGFEEVVLISDGFWRRSFAADPEILGRSIRLNGRELTVIGVMPPSFGFPETEDLWLPLGTDDMTDVRRRYIAGVGRLAPGVSRQQAAEVAQAITERAWAQHPETHEGWYLRAAPFRSGFVDADARRMLYLMLAAVGFVLLLACANVANLLLARATDRRRELAVRAALGAGRGRLVRQMLTESVLLGLAGGFLAIPLANAWVGSIARSLPDDLAYWMTITVDGSILVYLALLSVGTGVLFGLLPAFQVTGGGLSSGIREGDRSGSGAASGGKVRALLVTGEVALAVVLLVSATLMVRSFLLLQTAPGGFDSSALLSLRVNLSGDQFDETEARAAFFRELAERLEALPEIQAAGITSAIPADDGASDLTVHVPGVTDDRGLGAVTSLSFEGLFETLGGGVDEGRDFTAAEAADPEARVVLVGRALAARLWPRESPLGRSLRIEELDADFTVVGVVRDLQYEEFGEDLEKDRLQAHLPYAVSPRRNMAILVRAGTDPATVVGPVLDRLEALDPTQAAYDILTMDQRRAATTAPQRVIGETFGFFGLIGFLLAVGGVYAVVAYSVSQRTHEMGVRMALGASPRHVRQRVVLDALRLACGGLVIGLAMAYFFARGLRGALFGVEPGDPAVFAFVALAIGLAAILAGWLPARRASGVDPTEALRGS